MRGVTAHAGALRPTRGRGRLLESYTQPNAKGHTDSTADGNAHADGKLTFLTIGQFGPPMQSSTTKTLRV